MTEKEKVKAYDEAIERVKESYSNGITEEIFPELNEDDDEKIRRWIIDDIRYNINNEPLNNSEYKKKAEKAIAWLEKQGEQNVPSVNERAWLYLVSDVLTWKDGIGQYLDDPRVQELAKRLCSEYAHKLYNHSNSSNTGKNEQNSADKIEPKPKFKVGDWVVDNRGYVWKIEEMLKGILNHFYLLEGVEGVESRPTIDWVDKTFHLYTIEDTKDGDILSFYSDYKGKKMFQIGIVEKYVGKLGGCSNTFKTYVGMDWDNNLQIDRYMGCDDIQPATKEQRDGLMKAMSDAMYEWDIEKKELKKKRKR